MSAEKCAECGALWQTGVTCLEHFYQLLAWEFEDFTGAGAVHHLTVLCYSLQHPRVYSPQAFEDAKRMLAQYVVEGRSPQEIRTQNKALVDSGHRTYKIGGSPEAYGVYAYPIVWTKTIEEITVGGLVAYCERVEAWAQSIYDALVTSGNYTLNK